MATKDRTALKDEFKNGNLATGERFADLIDSMKVVQEPVEDPAASGTSLSFIASIEQNADGKITAMKKTLDLENAHELNPFKGWYKTGDTLPTDGFDGAYLYFKDTSELTGQTTIYRWNGTAYADTGTVVDTSNVQTFETGQAVNGVAIDGTGLANPLPNALAKAEDVKTVKDDLKSLDEQINGGDIETEENHDNTEFTRTSSDGANAIERTNKQPVVESTWTSIWALPIPDNTTRIEAVCDTNNQYYYGLSFFNRNVISVSTFLEGVAQQEGNYLSIDSSDFPDGATHIVVSASPTVLPDAYVKFYTTEHVDGIVVDSLDSNDATKALSAKQGKILNEKTNGLIVQEKGNSTISAMSQKAVTDIIDGVTSVVVTELNSDVFAISNRVVDRINNQIAATSGYCITAPIEIPSNLIKFEVFGFFNNPYYGGAGFKLTKSTYSLIGCFPKVSELPGNTNGGPAEITKEYIDSNFPAAKYIVFCAADNSTLTSCYLKTYTSVETKGLEERIEDLEESVSSVEGYSESMIKESHSIIGKAASLTTSDELAITIPDTCNHYQISFSMNLPSNFDGRIQLRSNHVMCHGRIEIDGTNVYFYDSNADNASPSRTIPHGLTIQNNISVTVVQKKINWQAVTIILITDNGIFTDENVNNYWYMAYNVPLTLKMVSGSCTNAELVFTMSEKSVWLFGDSYVDYIIRRVNSALNDSIKNLLIDGFPGRTSQQALASLNKSLAIATPRILVWGMGMNDSDDNGEIDTNWLSAYNSINEICQRAGIELVLVTIPTTPTRDNNEKNAFIKNSGHRYVDVATAVGADGTGTWTTGYLSSDNVHPTIDGARVVLGKYVASLPEIFG